MTLKHTWTSEDGHLLDNTSLDGVVLEAGTPVKTHFYNVIGGPLDGVLQITEIISGPHEGRIFYHAVQPDEEELLDKSI